jgi:phosphate-selective porin OprO/OprP
LLPSRNVGVVWNDSNPERYSSWALGVFNDWFDAGQHFDESATQYVGRFAWSPWHTDDDSNLLHLGIGYRYSNGREGFRTATGPEINQAPDFVGTSFASPSGVLLADRIKTLNAEVSWRRGPMWLASEYTRGDVTSPTIGSPSFDGYWLAASWAITGEMRPYNVRNGTFGALPIARSVDQGGRGAFEVTARWSNVDLTDGLIEGGEMDIASLGLTWWLTPVFAVGLDYREISTTRLGAEGRSSGLNTRVLLILE